MKKILYIIIVIIIANFVKNQNCEGVTEPSESNCEEGVGTATHKCAYFEAVEDSEGQVVQAAKCDLTPKNCEDITEPSDENWEIGVGTDTKKCT